MKLVFISFFGLLYLTIAKDPSCESFCRFHFCTNFIRSGTNVDEENPDIALGSPYAHIAGNPCFMKFNGGYRIFTNITAGEAQVSKEFSGDPFVPISEYRTDTVQPPIPSNFFQVVRNARTGRQFIGRIPPMGNQDEVLDHACVRVPITSYFVATNRKGIRRTNMPKGPRACIGFRTQAVQLLVSFEWSTSNDFDLHLIEPSGFEINRFGDISSRTSPSGGHLVSDIAAEVCEVESGREVIRYPSKDCIVEPGKYIIRVDHNRLCWTTSPFRLRVFFKGKVILDESGDLMKVGQNVLERTFTIPAMDNGIWHSH